MNILKHMHGKFIPQAFLSFGFLNEMKRDILKQYGQSGEFGGKSLSNMWGINLLNGSWDSPFGHIESL